MVSNDVVHWFVGELLSKFVVNAIHALDIVRNGRFPNAMIDDVSSMIDVSCIRMMSGNVFNHIVNGVPG